MIAAQEAVRTARSLMGTPYSEMDCIALIRTVIKRSAGGVPDYRCEGTNWLWKSVNNSAKYRHLVWRQESLDGARCGMLAFKRRGDDIHHVGLVTGDGSVIHSSSSAGCVVETALNGEWACLGEHQEIAVERMQSEKADEEDEQREENVQAEQDVQITIIDSVGQHFVPVGDWRVLIGSVD